MKPTLHLIKNISFITLLLFASTFNANGQCPEPEGIVLYNITATTVDAIWDTAVGAIRYEYAIGTDTAAPSGGVSAINTNAALQGLSPDTKYCFHVRAVCANGYSNWTRQCFTTTCRGVSVADLIVDKIIGSTARGAWKPFPSGINYEYVINQSSTPPTTNTTSTTATTIMFQGLAPNANYCLHVRSLCQVSNTYTDWATTCFKTPPAPNSISGVYHSGAVTIYPNPTSDKINVKFTELNGTHNLVVKDITGRTVYQTVLLQKLTQVNLASLTTGIYFINISGAFTNIVQRIVKE